MIFEWFRGIQVSFTRVCLRMGCGHCSKDNDDLPMDLGATHFQTNDVVDRWLIVTEGGYPSTNHYLVDLPIGFWNSSNWVGKSSNSFWGEQWYFVWYHCSTLAFLNPGVLIMLILLFYWLFTAWRISSLFILHCFPIGFPVVIYTAHAWASDFFGYHLNGQWQNQEAAPSTASSARPRAEKRQERKAKVAFLWTDEAMRRWF